MANVPVQHFPSSGYENIWSWFAFHIIFIVIPTDHLAFKTFEKRLQVGCLDIVVSTTRTRGDRHWDVIFLQMVHQFTYAW